MSSNKPNTNKVILITGAASGIGAATAKHLAAQGYLLCLSDINDALLKTVCPAIAQINSRSVLGTYEFDVSDPRPALAWFKEVGEELKKHPELEIHGVFNCAGVNPTPTELGGTTDEYFEKLVSVNLKGTFNVCKAAGDYLHPGAVVVNVSSIMGLHPSALNSVYCATKYAVIGFSKSLALEWGPRGIRVNVVAPGFIDTPTNSGVMEGEKGIQAQVDKVAMGRMGTADEVASVVGFLFSDDSKYMNGSVIEVNGGTG